MTRPRLAIRADVSVEIGTGHVRRCLSLAAGLRARGWDCMLVTRDLGTDVHALAGAASVETLMLPSPPAEFMPEADDPAHAGWARIGWRQDADQTVAALASDPPAVVLVDHYAFDARWHDGIRQHLGARLVAIDDLGDRALHVDIIVDPTLNPDHDAKHRLSSAFAPAILGGPSYALLASTYGHRPPFRVREKVESVGVFMGGSDVHNATVTAWQAIRMALGPEVSVEIAITSANPHLDALVELAGHDSNASLLIDAPDLVGFFAQHDLQVGAGGGATWERCCIGTPTVLVAFAENQVPVARPLDRDGIVLFSEGGGRDAAALARDVASLAADQSRRAAMSERARALVDGHGVERVREALHDLLEH